MEKVMETAFAKAGAVAVAVGLTVADTIRVLARRPRVRQVIPVAAQAVTVGITLTAVMLLATPTQEVTLILLVLEVAAVAAGLAHITRFRDT